MKYSTDYKIREWQARHNEIEKILYDINKMDFFIKNEDSRLSSLVYELERKLYKRKCNIEKWLDTKGTNLY